MSDPGLCPNDYHFRCAVCGLACECNCRVAECNYCFQPFLWDDRRVETTTRPSDPSELVAIMAACPACGIEQGLPTPDDLEDDLEAGKLPGIAFLTV